MLHEFITINHDEIVARTRQKLTSRPWPPVSTNELENGVPLFLTQLSETLRYEGDPAPPPGVGGGIGPAATRHGRELLELGFDMSQVVHDYGDICQAVTELALEQNAPITVEEFHTLNRCLDTAIAEAVTEHARITAQTTTADEVERLGHMAHELRNLLHTAFLAFQTLKRGTVSIGGSTGAVLGRSLMGLREIVDRSLSEVRLVADKQRRERVKVAEFLDEIGATGNLYAGYQEVRFTVNSVDPKLAVNADPQLLASAVMNLLHNAFKYTRAGGRVEVRAFKEDGHVLIEVEDECGGIPASKSDPFQVFGERRARDRSGLGLGLSIARKAIRAQGGDIHVRNMPGKGCVFVVDVPLAAETISVPHAIV